MIIRKEMFKKSKGSPKKIKVLIPGKKFNLIKQGQNFGVSQIGGTRGGRRARRRHHGAPGFGIFRVEELCVVTELLDTGKGREDHGAHGGSERRRRTRSGVLQRERAGEGRVSCERGEGPGGSGVSKRVGSEWGGSRRWKQEVASPPVRAPRRRPPGKEGDDWRLALVGWAVLGHVR